VIVQGEGGISVFPGAAVSHKTSFADFVCER